MAELFLRERRAEYVPEGLMASSIHPVRPHKALHRGRGAWSA